MLLHLLKILDDALFFRLIFENLNRIICTGLVYNIDGDICIVSIFDTKFS